jgi:enamine deaminase RidA (YjgF/YER057c/UK114 family)
MSQPSLQSSEENRVSVYDKLKTLQISLTQSSAPAGAYVPYVRTGNLLFLSGHIARKDGKPLSGQLGGNLTTEQGKEAARGIAIALMATLESAVGDLDKITRIVKLMVLVNSTPTFTEQHLVGNGASELFREVFGESGLHARSAFGVAQIPLGSCVEIERIAEVE